MSNKVTVILSIIAWYSVIAIAAPSPQINGALGPEIGQVAGHLGPTLGALLSGGVNI